MPSAVLDTNIVIGLAKGGVFDRLAALYSPLFIPSTVRQEVISQGPGLAGEPELSQALGAWITEAHPAPQTVQQFSASLAAADREVLAVAQIEAVTHILSDDRGVYKEASRHGLTCLRSPEILVLMKRRGLIPSVKSVLNSMRAQGYGIADALYDQALQVAGE